MKKVLRLLLLYFSRFYRKKPAFVIKRKLYILPAAVIGKNQRNLPKKRFYFGLFHLIKLLIIRTQGGVEIFITWLIFLNLHHSYPAGTSWSNDVGKHYIRWNSVV